VASAIPQVPLSAVAHEGIRSKASLVTLYSRVVPVSDYFANANSAKI
jgi:hypothetical protein